MIAFQHVDVVLDEGIAEVRLHTDGDSMVWSASIHEELPRAFGALADHPGIKTVILTGTGRDFCTRVDSASFRSARTPWHVMWWEGRRILQRLVDVDVPVISVLNGPATLHAELLFLADIVIAADTASVSDSFHFVRGTVPGDGVHLVWPHLLGPLRGKHFLLTGQTLTAAELLDLGAVSEVVAAGRAMDRARELAVACAAQPLATLRYTRALLADPLRRLLQEGLSHGLGVEGAHTTLE